MSEWSVKYYTGSSWTSATDLNNPWEVESSYSSQDRVSPLVRGGQGWVTPSTSVWSSLRLSWSYKTQAFRSQMMAFLTGNRVLQLTDNSSTPIVYVMKVNSISQSYVVLEGVIGYSITADMSQVTDPS